MGAGVGWKVLGALDLVEMDLGVGGWVAWVKEMDWMGVMDWVKEMGLVGVGKGLGVVGLVGKDLGSVGVG